MITSKPFKKAFLLFGILYLCSFTVFGQKNESSKFQLWADAGFGLYGSTGKNTGLSPSISLNLYQNKTLYKMQYIHLAEIGFSGPVPSEIFNSYGILLGKGISNDKVSLIFSAGLGATTGIKRGALVNIDDPHRFERDNFFTPSIPLEIDIIWKITKFFGPNMTLFADLNIKRPYLGYRIKFSIGKLR